MLTPAALDSLAELHRGFDGRDPDGRLAGRRVEITGPTDAKMTINALNSGAQV